MKGKFISGFLLILLFLCPEFVQGSSPKQKSSPPPTGSSDSFWVKFFGSGSISGGYSVAPASDGGASAVGYTFPANQSAPRTWILRLSPAGAKRWEKTFEGAVHGSEDYAICRAADGGFVALMPKQITDRGVIVLRVEMRLIRLSGEGEILWDKTIPGKSPKLQAIAAALDGGFFLGGFDSHQVGTSASAAWILKVDGQGHKVWEKYLRGAGSVERGSAVMATSDNGCVFAYTAWDGGFNLARLNATGGVSWERSYGWEADTGRGKRSDLVRSLFGLPEGGMILSGGSRDAGHPQGFVMKLDDQGHRQWDRYFESTQDWMHALPMRNGHVLALAGMEGAVTATKLDQRGLVVESKVWKESGRVYQISGGSSDLSGPGARVFLTGSRTAGHTKADLFVMRLTEKGEVGRPLQILPKPHEPIIRSDVFKLR